MERRDGGGRRPAARPEGARGRPPRRRPIEGRPHLSGEAPPPIGRRRLLAAGLVAPWSAGLTGCGADAALDGLASGGVSRVTSVPTGDALALDDGRLVKLAGVEAPRGGDAYAVEARDTLSRLALGRRASLLFTGPHEDSFGRTVAQVRIADDRSWVEGALTLAGAVRVRTTASARALAQPLLQRETTARRARRGLWALEAYRVKLPDELDREEGGFQIVEGRVRRAGETSTLAYLDFSERWRDEASVEIPVRALRDFRAAALDPLRLEGRLIRVRGEARGLRIAVDHPEALELLRG